MNFSVFLQSFSLCFLVLISVGPVFLTTANIAMTRGYKNGFFAIFGCIIADSVFITAGAIAAKTIVASIPQICLILLTLFAGCYLMKISYGFWKTDIEKIKTQKIKKTNFALTFKMFLLTFSSPLSIIGYGTIFSQIIDGNTSVASTILGGVCASCFTHSLIVSVFATIGKKVNYKILLILNKISALLIFGFSCSLLVKFCQSFYKYVF